MLIRLLTVLISFLLFSLNAQARSCSMPLEFIFKCENNICQDGFFAFKKLSGAACSSILNVLPDDKNYKLAALNLKGQQLSNGFYSLQMRTKPVWDHDLKYAYCIKQNEHDELLLMGCSPKLEKLNIPENDSLQSLKDSFVAQSRRADLLNTVGKWALPLFFLLLIAASFTKWTKKHRKKTLTAIILITVFGLFELMTFGDNTWSLCGMIGFLFFVFLGFRKIFRKLRKRTSV